MKRDSGIAPPEDVIEAIEAGLPTATHLGDPAGHLAQPSGNEDELMDAAPKSSFDEPSTFEQAEVAVQRLFAESEVPAHLWGRHWPPREARDDLSSRLVGQRVKDRIESRRLRHLAPTVAECSSGSA
jgi:hypothetical protein